MTKRQTVTGRLSCRHMLLEQALETRSSCSVDLLVGVVTESIEGVLFIHLLAIMLVVVVEVHELRRVNGPSEHAVEQAHGVVPALREAHKGKLGNGLLGLSCALNPLKLFMNRFPYQEKK